MDHLERFKERISSVVDISDQDLEEVVTRFELRKFAKNDFLLNQGGKCNFWGFLLKGLVRVYSHAESGEDFTNGFIREDDFITESMSFFTDAASLENMEALENTEMICIGPAKLNTLYIDFPVFEKFTRISYEQRMIELKARILYRVQFNGQGRYEYFVKTQPELYRRVPLKYIASYLNLTDSTLSRIRRKAIFP